MRAYVLKNPGDYRWSSYHAYAYERKDLMVDENHIYQELSDDESGRRMRYGEFVEGLLQTRDAMEGRWIGE